MKPPLTRAWRTYAHVRRERRVKSDVPRPSRFLHGVLPGTQITPESSAYSNTVMPSQSPRYTRAGAKSVGNRFRVMWMRRSEVLSWECVAGKPVDTDSKCSSGPQSSSLGERGVFGCLML